ncbi:M20/M25/M40 family metallo-hydrolase [Bacillus sp. N9]
MKDGVLHGRGSVDMLSGLASMVMAMEAIAESGVKLKGDLWLGVLCVKNLEEQGFLQLLIILRKTTLKSMQVLWVNLLI